MYADPPFGSVLCTGGAVKWTTFEEVWQRARRFGRGLAWLTMAGAVEMEAQPEHGRWLRCISSTWSSSLRMSCVPCAGACRSHCRRRACGSRPVPPATLAPAATIPGGPGPGDVTGISPSSRHAPGCWGTVDGAEMGEEEGADVDDDCTELFGLSMMVKLRTPLRLLPVAGLAWIRIHNSARPKEVHDLHSVPWPSCTCNRGWTSHGTGATKDAILQDQGSTTFSFSSSVETSAQRLASSGSCCWPFLGPRCVRGILCDAAI